MEWLHGLPGPVAVAYEAGPTGFGLARTLSAAGIRCEVAAPSKLSRPPGDHVKTDAKDALHLARLLRRDDLVSVRVPTVSQEASEHDRGSPTLRLCGSHRDTPDRPRPTSDPVRQPQPNAGLR